MSLSKAVKFAKIVLPRILFYHLLCLSYTGIFLSLKYLCRNRRQWHPTPVFLPENPMDGGAWQTAVHGVAKTSLSLFAFMHWRRQWQPTPVFLPGESQGQGSLVGCRLWGRTESDTTEATQQQQCRNKKEKLTTTFGP